jgi:hypothetical protein
LDTTNDKCEDVVYDPKTLKKIPIANEVGYQLFKYKMIYYFNKYLNNTKNDWNYVLPENLNKMDKSNIFILDVRKPIDYKKKSYTEFNKHILVKFNETR